MTKVLIVDDQKVVRELLKTRLENYPEIEIVGVAANGQAGLELARGLQPDVALMDITMPTMNGIDATRYMTKEIGGVRVLMLTTHDEEEYLKQAIAAGASGYMLKNTPEADLVYAIKTCSKKNFYIGPSLLNKYLGEICSTHTIIAEIEQRLNQKLFEMENRFDKGQPKTKTRVLIVDDQKVVRELLKARLENYPQLEIVGIAANGQAGLELARDLQPDVALMDITMPVMNGIEAAKSIAQEMEGVRVLMLTTHDEEEYLKQAIAAGASGYMLKNTPEADLIYAIETCSQENFYIGPTLLNKYLGEICSTHTTIAEIERRLNQKLSEMENLLDKERRKTRKRQQYFVEYPAYRTHVLQPSKFAGNEITLFILAIIGGACLYAVLIDS